MSNPGGKSTTPVEPAALATVRRIMLGLVALGTTGMTAELLLVGHFADPDQLIPLFVAALGLAAIVWVAASPGIVGLRALQFVMLLYAGSGVIGVTLHYKANVALQREADPGLQGMALLKKVITSTAPPALAPGLMVQLALLGLAFTYRHPVLMGNEVDR